MIYILAAMKREAEASGLPCTVIGIGAKNLPETTDEDVIVNVGYCGAVDIQPGTIVEPNEVSSYEVCENRKLPTHFDCLHVPCFTAERFVYEPCSIFSSVYDMELLKIAALPHKELYVLKIVSDNLDEAVCEKFSDEEAWEKVRTILKGANLI